MAKQQNKARSMFFCTLKYMRGRLLPTVCSQHTDTKQALKHKIPLFIFFFFSFYSRRPDTASSLLLPCYCQLFCALKRNSLSLLRFIFPFALVFLGWFSWRVPLFILIFFHYVSAFLVNFFFRFASVSVFCLTLEDAREGSWYTQRVYVWKYIGQRSASACTQYS